MLLKLASTAYLITVSVFAFSQKIVNVNQQAVGSKVIITYDITDAKANQIFDVALYCSNDNFSKALASVSGNGIGNEVKGVAQEVVNASDVVIEIPQYGTKHSLNISVSVGVVLWELARKLDDQ